MLFRITPLLGILAITLVACGGGGGDAPAAATGVDKYVGAWGICQPVTGATNGVLSAVEIFNYTKASESTLNLSIEIQGFKAAGCAGTVFNIIPNVGSATVTLNGTKLIGTQTVDRLNFVAKSATITEFNGNLKDVGLISGNTLSFGANSVADADGYPTQLDTVSVLTKR
jgi:hypothetical protein